MRWPIVKVIWFREVRDQLRDRRTVFMLVVLPLLLYPLLGLSMAQFAWSFVEQPIRVGVAGAELLEGANGEPFAPDRENPFVVRKLPTLLEGDTFADALLKDPSDHKLRVVRGSEASLAQMLRRGEIQAYVVFTEKMVRDLKEGRQAALDLHLKQAEEIEAGSSAGAARSAGDTGVSLYSDDDLSRLAYARLRVVFREWDRAILRARMEGLGAPPQYHEPLFIPPLEAKTERLWGRVFPFLLVMMSLTGALYPAIDVCAGEKERGTMETLLISPATRGEIVCGKFLTVWLFSAVTALLNLASLGLTAWQFSILAGNTAGVSGSAASPLPAPGFAALAWGVVLLVPLAAFFSATCLALAIYARSSKEGQYYLMPLLVVTLILTVLSLAPGAELSPVYSLLPITGAALLLKALVNATTVDQIPWLYLAPVLVPLAAYCYLALHWAVQQFKREEVLFREAERLDLQLWMKRLFREKEALPSAAQAMTCFLGILFLGWVLSAYTIGADPLTMLAVRQLAFIAAPTLFMTLMLTSQPGATLRLRWPKIGWLLLGVVLALAFHGPLVWAVKAILDRYPHVKEQIEGLARLVKLDAPLGVQLLVLAVVPAVCEELAFRGFILSGLARRIGADKAVLVSSLLFAFAHLNAFRFLPTFVLGCVLGLLATRSGSLLPGIVFHALHNGLVVLVSFFAARAQEGRDLPGWMNAENVYSWPALLLSGVAAIGLALWLFYQPPKPLLEERRESVGT
jgi:sodium transport system permease protein